MRVAVALLLAAFVFAPGCFDAIEGRFRASDVEAPRWNVGDWFRYQVTAPLYGTDATVTVVVAELVNGNYLVGTPVGEDAPLEALLFHMPAIGPVRSDISWMVHGERFEPASWPLDEGKTWNTKWITADVHFTSTMENGTWNISNEGFEEDAFGVRYEVRYDPAAQAITNFTRTGADGVVRQRIELVERGSNFTGGLRVPAYIDVALLETRTAGVLRQGVPAAPNPTFTPAEAADTLLVGCIVGGGPGQYHAEVRTPAGTPVCQRDETLQPGDTTFRLQVVEVANEAGAWEARLAAVGPGSATAEVLAYPLRNVTV